MACISATFPQARPLTGSKPLDRCVAPGMFSLCGTSIVWCTGRGGKATANAAEVRSSGRTRKAKASKLSDFVTEVEDEVRAA